MRNKLSKKYKELQIEYNTGNLLYSNNNKIKEVIIANYKFEIQKLNYYINIYKKEIKKMEKL